MTKLHYFICPFFIIFSAPRCSGFSHTRFRRRFHNLNHQQQVSYSSSNGRTAIESTNAASIPFPESMEFQGSTVGSMAEKVVNKERLRRQKQNLSPDITEIYGHIDYEEFLYEDDRLCVILFTAPWCKKCQRLKLKYKNKLARDSGDLIELSKQRRVMKKGSARFAEVDFADNRIFCEQNGIDKVPYIRMYKEGELVTEFHCGPTSIHSITSSIKQFQ